MKELVLAFCRCLSVYITCSVTKQQIQGVSRRFSANRSPVVVTKAPRLVISVFFVPLVRRFIAGLVAFCPSVMYSPTHRQGRVLMINIQSTLRTAPDLCKNVSLQCYLVATVIHIQSVRSQTCVCVCVCVYTHMFFKM